MPRSTPAMLLVVACAVCCWSGCRRTRDELESATPPEDPRAAHLPPSGVGVALPPSQPGPVDVTVDVRVDRGGTAISPLIYGINDELRGLQEQRWGVIRLGGNRYTAYNWENNASNAGVDWYFQNDSYVSGSAEPAAPVLRIIDGAHSIGAATVVTIPNVDYVAADKDGQGDVRKSGPRYLETRFRRNVAKKPTPLSPLPDVTDDSVYQDEFAEYLKSQRPSAALLFSMDNEPDLWPVTHAEVYPKPLTYADLWNRNHRFAAAIKDRFPDAKVLGFVSFGWGGITNLQNAPDAKGQSFVSWYLDQARAVERKEGRRLIDYLDVHWYPEAKGGGKRIVCEENTPELVNARVQAPRSFWDSTYKEDSWVTASIGGPIALLPRLRAKIEAHYPGTRIAVSEWNFGGTRHISGAIAVADVLGVFGREGIGLATYWPLSLDEPFAYAAFRIYRNYDGRGGQFGDMSVPATSSNVEAVTAYASIDANDALRVRVVVINKSDASKRVGLRVHHSALFGAASVHALLPTAPVVSQYAPLVAVGTNAFRFDAPPQSVLVIGPEP